MTTVTGKLPAAARAGALNAPVSCVLLTNVVVCVTPLTVTDDDGTKPAPVTVRVEEVEPTAAEKGDSAVMEGTGFGPAGGLTAMVTVFDEAPPIEMDTGTATPVADPDGTIALIWYTPTSVGARPENITAAVAPPMVTVGVAAVIDSGSVSAGEPLAG